MKIWIIISVMVTIAALVLYNHAADQLYTKIFCFLVLVNDFLFVSCFLVEGEEDEEENNQKN
jgi:EamA domain-containing membrane protein RarD